MIEMTHDEWQQKGEALFGPDAMKWRFRCPACGNVASIAEYKPYASRGAKPDSATQECIGRYLPKEQRGGFSSDHANPDIKRPCDYAAYGLFRLAPLLVHFPDGSKSPCFAFDEEPEEPMKEAA